VPQGRRVFAPLSVRDNLLVAARGPTASVRRRLARVTELFPPLERLMAREAWSLSGGEQQMLAIGRGLMGAPRLLLLDEPTLGLAPAVIADLYVALAAVREAGTALLIAEQDSRHALALAERALVLARGRVALAGEAVEISRHPRLAETMLGV
jgi:branched-chain amino acid transport system ATP-binding protein